MAGVIGNSRDAVAIARHCRETHHNAALADEALLETAEEFLRPGLDTAKRVTRRIEDADDALSLARARVRRESRSCDETLHDQHDLLWNRIGRRKRDLAWNKMFFRGVEDVIERTDRYKPDAMRNLAVRIVTVTHPKIPAEVAQAAAEAIRASADRLAAANEALVPFVTAHAALQTEYYTNARFLQVQLARLKKHWLAEGLTEQEIHEIIPDGRRPKAKVDEDPAPAAEPVEEVGDGEEEAEEPVSAEGDVE